MGKGGVGKSTVATALGIRATLEGKRTIICEVASAENTSRLFQQEEVGYREVELANDLWAISIDPDDSMREYVLLQLKVKAMRDLLFRSRMFTYLAEATPGLNELVSIGKVWELAQMDRKVRHGRKYDLVIVDAPATGHGITFLRTPRTFANIGALIVSLPEEMPVNETATLERELVEDIGVEVERVLVNAVYPDRFETSERPAIEALAGSDEQLSRAAGRAALSEVRRAAAQREQIERLEAMVSTPVSLLPFVFEPELTLAAARMLGEEIA